MLLINRVDKSVLMEIKRVHSHHVIAALFTFLTFPQKGIQTAQDPKLEEYHFIKVI